MKKLQAIFALPSAVLFLISVILDNRPLLLISLGGLAFAMFFRQIRLYKKGPILGHPKGRRGSDLDEDFNDEEN